MLKRSIKVGRQRVLNRRLLNRKLSRRANVEQLEPRMLMTASPSSDDAFQGLLSHGGICGCPICSGRGIELIETISAAPAAAGALSSIASIPALNSLAGAAATVFLDFNGHTQSSWGEYTNVVTRVFDRDGDESTFSDSELATITEIWTRVAEDFSPFNINVTTVDPGSVANRVAVRVAIGGNWSDWFGQAAGGVAYIGAFYNSAPNTAYVFEDALGNGNARYVAEAASHEAGHTFGLLHQSLWSGGVLVDEYYEGNSAWAPIMGVGYYSARTTWHNGTNDNGPTSYQDDMAILANSSNGFGYRADDFGSTLAAAAALAVTGNSVNVSGRIGSNGDQDFFSFTTGGGAVNLQLNVAQFGANLDAVLELRNSSGSVIATANPSTSFGASLATTLGSGTYYVAAGSSGGYGNVGQYTLTGTIAGVGSVTTPSPEVSLAISGTDVASGGTVDFGSTFKGTAVTRTITVRNTGTATLNLTRLTTAGMPAGFSLVSNLGGTSLAVGQSTTFTVRLTASAIGSYGGSITLLNSDSDEGAYTLNLSGTVTAPPPPAVRIIDNGAAGFSTTGTWRRLSGSGRDRDIHYAAGGDGSAAASWTFSGVLAGQYRVHASWTASRINATNAPFSVYDGTSLLATVGANQERASSGLTTAGTRWSNLGTFTVVGNELVIRLTNGANDRVVADAIRIERIGGTSAAAVSHSATVAGSLATEDSHANSAAIFASLGSFLGSSQIRAQAPSSTSVNLDLPHSSPRVMHDTVFSSGHDLRPEVALLEETLDLLREAESVTSRGGRSEDSLTLLAQDLLQDDLLFSPLAK